MLSSSLARRCHRYRRAAIGLEYSTKSSPLLLLAWPPADVASYEGGVRFYLVNTHGRGRRQPQVSFDRSVACPRTLGLLKMNFLYSTRGICLRQSFATGSYYFIQGQDLL